MSPDRVFLSKIGGNIAFIAGTAAALLFFVEAVCRFFALGPPDPRPWRENPDLYRICGRSYCTRADVLFPIKSRTGAIRWLKTNNLGLREDESCTKSEKGVFRVLLLGDEIIAGEIANKRTLAASLEQNLTRVTGHKLRVLNAGVRGYGPYEIAIRADLVEKLDVNAVLVTINAGNDLLEGFLGKSRFKPINKFRTIRLLSAWTYEQLSYLGLEIKDFTVRNQVVEWLWPRPAGEGLSQAIWLQRGPGKLNRALNILQGRLKKIEQVCRTHGIKMYILLAPCWLSMPKVAQSLFPRISHNLVRLSPSAASSLQKRIEKRIIEKLSSLEQNVFEPKTEMNVKGGWFTRSDYLLSMNGKQALGGQVTGWLLSDYWFAKRIDASKRASMADF
ncbi:MAG: SGNH/GDSL hydrolase family protein [Deltaproteobacteria bacterium]|nr:SGNH/GDSL hydrolase family protein [Deltaproteobacteria bacterium]